MMQRKGPIIHPGKSGSTTGRAQGTEVSLTFCGDWEGGRSLHEGGGGLERGVIGASTGLQGGIIRPKEKKKGRLSSGGRGKIQVDFRPSKSPRTRW